MITATDSRALRLPLSLLCLALIAGSSFVGYAQLTRARAQTQLAAQRILLDAARSRYQKSGGKAASILRYLAPYHQFQRQGIIGPESRIDWLTALRNANQQAQLFGVAYQLGAQQPYPQIAAEREVRLFQSPMTLDFRVLHEEDLLRFFDALEKQQVGLFTIRRCLLERASEQAHGGLQPSLRAECELAWLTLQPGISQP